MEKESVVKFSQKPGQLQPNDANAVQGLHFFKKVAPKLK
jgi:hypothetical protein